MARPKGNKQGTVYFDKNCKKWRAIYYIVDPESKENKRITKSFNSEDEAKGFLASKLYQKNNEIFIKNNGIPIGQLMRANVQKKLDMNLISETQYARVLSTIEVIEKSPIANIKIEDITSDEIQDYLNTLTHYSNSYIKKIYEQFTQSFKFAMNRGYITRNPLVDVIKPKSSKPDKVVRALEISAFEIKALLSRKNLLNDLYGDWLTTDIPLGDVLVDSLIESILKITNRFSKQQNEKELEN